VKTEKEVFVPSAMGGLAIIGVIVAIIVIVSMYFTQKYYKPPSKNQTTITEQAKP
jgi:hypothetical protein